MSEDYKQSYAAYKSLDSKTNKQSKYIGKKLGFGEFKDKEIFNNGNFSIKAQFLGYDYHMWAGDEPEFRFFIQCLNLPSEQKTDSDDVRIIIDFPVDGIEQAYPGLESNNFKKNLLSYAENMAKCVIRHDHWSIGEAFALQNLFKDNVDAIMEAIYNFFDDNPLKKYDLKKSDINYATSARKVDVDRKYSQFRKEFEDEYVPEANTEINLEGEGKVYITWTDGKKVEYENKKGQHKSVPVDYIKRFGSPVTE